MAVVLAQRLPPEVVDLIVDGNRGDKKTLSCCSLVCKSWLQSSRYTMFSDLDVFIGPNVGAAFLKLLHRPMCTIWYCIRAITIYPGQPNEQGEAGLGETTVTGLAKLKHVNSLRILNHRGLIPKATLALLASGFSEITTLRIANQFPSFSDAIEFVALFPLLQNLNFNPYCIDATPTTSTGTVLPSPLHSLHLHSTFRFGPWFSERRGGVQSLSLSTMQVRDIPTVKDMLSTFGSDLCHLSLTFAEGQDWPSGTDLQHCAREFAANVTYLSNTRLSSLQLKTFGSPGTILLSLLETMRTPNLEVLTFECGPQRDAQRDAAQWAKVDARISDRSAFKRLKKLHFVGGDFGEGFLIRNNLPKADALGIVITERFG